jgi:hypothetical protein
MKMTHEGIRIFFYSPNCANVLNVSKIKHLSKIRLELFIYVLVRQKDVHFIWIPLFKKVFEMLTKYSTKFYK